MYRDTYVFALDESGTELATAAFPELVGKNLLTLQEFPFKDQIREEIRFAKTRGEGWIQGAWPRPGELEPKAETIYLKSIPLHGRLHIFGSAIYEADAAKQ
jgi:signal transduction histidine kinase